MGAKVRLISRITNSRFFRSEYGGNAAEFALVCLPMAVLTFVIIQVGSLAYAYNDMHNAAREGVRRLAVEDNIPHGDANIADSNYGPMFTCDGTGTTPPANSVEEVVCIYILGWNRGYSVQARVLPPDLPAEDCHEVSVRVTADMGAAALFDMFGTLTGRQMSAEATMLSEYEFGGTDNYCE